MDPVIHFQMPAEDRKRVADFYAKVFGWQTKQLGPEMGNYILATTTESDEKGMSKKPGAINGGFFTKTKPDQYPGVVIQVEDIKEAMKKVEAAGGTVLGGRTSSTAPDEMPGLGLFISIRDTEGNLLTLMQPARQ
jgi:predicted enzyme related to lactoylglutathione lyase